MSKKSEDKMGKYLGEAVKPKWFDDPIGYRDDLARRVQEVSRQIENVTLTSVGFANRVLKIIDNAVFKLETEMLKAKKVKY